MNKYLPTVFVIPLLLISFSFCTLNAVGQNLLVMSPSFESGSGNGPGSSLDGGMWFRTHQGFAGTEVQNIVYRKTENPAPQHLTSYVEAATPNDPHFNAVWKLQAINNQNLTTTLTNGEKYKVSFYYQNSSNHTFTVSIENVNGSGNLVNYAINTAANDWTFASFEFTLDNTILTNGRIKLNFGLNQGISRIDNIVLESMAPPPTIVNLLTLSPSFESGNGSGPGTTLDGGMWFRTHQGFAGTEVQNIIYRKTENPAPQHLTAYLEAITPNDPHFNAGWKLQATNNQNLTSTLVNGKRYKVSFYYQNSAAHTFSISIENNNGSGNLVNYAINSEATSWTYAEFEFTMDNTVLINGRLKINLGANAGTTRVDNMVLSEVVVLPVNLLSFIAIPNNPGVKLLWRTSTEINNSHFEIDRSLNGRDFEKIGTVDAKNGGDYNFIDHKIVTGNIYYQLKQFDNDGSSKLLGTRMVKLSNVSVSTNPFYPNPITGSSINLHTNELPAGNYFLTVTDMQGKVRFTKTIGVSNGNVLTTITLPGKLSTGQYIFKIAGKEQSISEKIIVQ